MRFGGNFELRTRTRELYREGMRLKLRPQPFQVLEMLVRNAGEVVSREELRQRLWASDTFVDFEHGLNSSVKSLRAVLGDSVLAPRYIETVPKLGYRFIAPVEPAPQEPPVRALEEPEPITPMTAHGEPGQPRSRRLAAAALVTAALVAGSVFLSRRTRTPPRPSRRVLMAVLPFENLTGDSSQEFVTDGLTEEIIARLGRVDPERVGVIAGTSVRQPRYRNETPEDVGRRLGAEYVLEGDLRRDAEHVRITAKLVRVQDHAAVWSQEYQRAANSLIALQEEIALETADAIRPVLGEQKRPEAVHASTLPSQNQSDAYLHYLKGRYFWNKRTEPGFQQAIREFQSAIDKQPSYAPAYAGLSDAYALSVTYSYLPLDTYMPKARAAALRALELDESLAEAHTSLASVAQNYEWDWQTAEKEYRRAIELNPSYATAHHWYGECLGLEGRFDEAFVEFAKARELDPLSLIISADYGVMLYFSRQYGPAIQQFHTVLDMDPDFGRAQMIAFAYVEEGRFPEALQVADRWTRTFNAGWAWPTEAYIYGRWGKASERPMRETLKLAREGRVSHANLLMMYIGLGNREKALESLEAAYAEHAPGLTAIKVDPAYDSLRAEPRFQKVLKGIRLDK